MLISATSRETESLPGTFDGAANSRGRPKAAMIVRELHAKLVYPDAARRRAAGFAEILNANRPMDADLWSETEVILGGWGMPVLSEAFLRGAPRLKAVFYAAGSVRGFMTDAAWDRGIIVSTATAANSATTAEFCVGEILFSLKHGWRFIRDMRRSWKEAYHHDPIVPGLFGSRVGLVSMGRVARRVADLLRPFPVEVVAWDPLQPDSVFARHGVSRIDLDELLRTSDVVSLHLPLLPQTRGLIDSRRISSMKRGATLINTSRGEVLDQDALIRILSERSDLTAVLDVTNPEPPPQTSPLFDLPNLVMTPHIAGCYGHECRRLGSMALDECERWIAGRPLLHALTREQAELLA